MPPKPNSKQTIRIMLPPQNKTAVVAGAQAPAPPPQQQLETARSPHPVLPLQSPPIAPPQGAPAIQPLAATPVPPVVPVQPAAPVQLMAPNQGIPTDQVAPHPIPHPATPISPSQVAQTVNDLTGAVERIEKSVGSINYEQLGKQVAANVDFRSEITAAIGKKQQIFDLVLASIALVITLGVLVTLMRI